MKIQTLTLDQDEGLLLPKDLFIGPFSCHTSICVADRLNEDDQPDGLIIEIDGDNGLLRIELDDMDAYKFKTSYSFTIHYNEG